jgi:hypothetical protein
MALSKLIDLIKKASLVVEYVDKKDSQFLSLSRIKIENLSYLHTLFRHFRKI